VPRRAHTRPRRAPRQRRAEDTVAILLDATERVVSKSGFHAATTNAIAKVAGVSIGTLYHYFPTKEALVSGVVHRMWEAELASFMDQASAFLELPLDEAIRVAVRALVATIAKRIDLYRSWYTEAPHLGELSQGLEMSSRAAMFVRAALEHRRELLLPADLDFAADIVVKTTIAIARTGARDYPTQMKDGRLAAELSDMIIRYLVR
jgi:AcrR family transcriptional regulator